MKTFPGFFACVILTSSLIHQIAKAESKNIVLEAMPANLEMQFALSALPSTLRADASVYLLDTKEGYKLVRKGKSRLECLVERTVWEWADYRDDIYIPLCYDANGANYHLKIIRIAAQMRAAGIDAVSLKKEIEKRYASGLYSAPVKAGLSYMISPVMRANGPPDMKVHTMTMPHLMFYAPDVTNDELGAKPNLQDPESLNLPFIDTQGISQQSYIIQMIGEAEKAKILANEKELMTSLCAYRDVLCIMEKHH